MSKVDITEDAILLLRAIAETKGRFGFSLPIEVLLGKRNARIQKGGFDQLSSHGSGAHKSEEHWKTIGTSLVQELLVDSRNAGKGYGKGKQMAVYSVSSLGQRLLDIDSASPDGAAAAPGNVRVSVDLAAEAAATEAARAKRSQRMSAAKRGRSQVPSPQQAAAARSLNAAPAMGTPSPNASATSRLSGSSASPGDSAAKRRRLPDSAKGHSPHQRSPVASGMNSQEDGLRPPHNPGEIRGGSPLPSALDAALMPFQRSGVAFAVRRGGRVLIGDDMGLGKTIQAIATCCAFREDWPALIVVPNSVRFVWADELERWIPDMGPGAVNVVKSSQDVAGLSGPACFHIVTYGLLSRASPLRDFLRLHSPFKIVVVDESHMIKNRTACRTKEILQIVRQASRPILLSGTPALARPVELYTQIEAVEPGLFKSFSAFTSRYCAPKWTPFGMDFNGSSNLQELNGLLRPIMVRRLKADVLTELPEKRRQRISLEVDGAAANACATLKEELQACGEADQMERHQFLVQLYKETSKAKEGPASEYMEDLLQGGCKFLIFGHHLSMLDALEATAERNKVKSIRIDGSVSASERLRRVNEFQSSESVRVAILGVNAAGVGITLTAASTVVFAELHWTPGILVQAEDRAHRIGQKSSVNVHYLVASGTIDDIIWPSVSRKVEVVSKLCDGQADHLVAAYTAKDKAVSAAGGGANGAASGAHDYGDMDELVAAVAVTPPAKARAKSEGTAQKSSEPPNLKCDEQKGGGPSILSMLQGQRPQMQSWSCKVCTASNTSICGPCSTCGAPRGATAAQSTKKVAAGSCPIDVIESASDSDDPGKPPENHDRFAFTVSRITSRVHVLHADGRPFGANFKFSDWDALRDPTAFPAVLRGDPAAEKATVEFMSQWSALKASEQRNLSDQELHLPLSAYLRKKKAAKK